MIVLGPHVCADNSNFKEETPHTEEAAQQRSYAVAAVVQVHRTNSCDENIMNQYDEARLQVSTILGSIGADPLSPSLHYSSASPACIDESIISSYIKATIQLAESQYHLIRTITHAVKLISTGTSLRLGLGPTNLHLGNGRVVSRAEKAWSERVKSKNIEQHPQLTLQRSRRLLHQAMVDQVSSLRGILPSSCRDNQEYVEWDEFIDDMKYFSRMTSQQTAPVLTLSKLSFWLNGLRGLLSFVMSHLLSGSFMTTDWNGIIISLKQSSQFTHERIKFVQSAFNLTPDEHDLDQPSKTPDDQARGNVESRRNAMKMIHQLQSTLEAAQVSLWAFSQSRAHKQVQTTDTGDKDSIIWWSQLKDFLSQTELSVGHYEATFFTKPAQEEETENITGDLSVENDHSNATHGAVLVANVDDISNTNKVRNTEHLLAQKEHADKTWVFSGSGIHKKSKPLRLKNIESDSANVSTSSEMFGQTMLMRDLQNRLKTIKLAEEHEVVKLDACNEDNFERNPKQKSVQSTPFFLGVGGSLLTELASAIRSDVNQGDFIGDDNVITCASLPNTTVAHEVGAADDRKDSF